MGLSWKSGSPSTRAAGSAGRTIFSLEADAELVIVPHSRTGFEPVQRYEVATSATWAQPTLAGNRLFVKDVDSLTLWTVD